jgi:hypothetical protein
MFVKKNLLFSLALVFVLFFSITVISGASVGSNSSLSNYQSNGFYSSYGINDSFSKIYVATNGSDDYGNGSIDNPYQNLKKAMEQSNNCTVIYVASGSYSHFSNGKLIVDKSIIISSFNGFVSFNGENKTNFFEVTREGNLTLIGLNLYRGSSGSEYLAGGIVNYGELNIINSKFENNTGFRAGAILNFANLYVFNSTFRLNNGVNYGGGISNFGNTNIQLSSFLGNSGNRGSGIISEGNISIISSNFSSNTIESTNLITGSLNNHIFLSNVNVESLNIVNATGYIYDSYISPQYLGLRDSNIVVNHSVLSSVSLYDSIFNISYSVILGRTIDKSYFEEYCNNNITADYNWWLSNKKPGSNVKYWIIAVFEGNNGSNIISKTNSSLSITFKYTDGVNVYDLPNGINIPSRFLYLETDNGYFSNSAGYIINNSFSSLYLNNSEDTIVYAVIDNLRLRLLVGTGSTNYSIYVSNDGADYNDGSMENPYKTLSKAVSMALNGNTIYIYTGDYYDAFNSKIDIKKNLTFTSFNGPVTIFKHMGDTIFTVFDYGQLNLYNITLTSSNFSMGSILINSLGGLVLDGCTLKNNVGSSSAGNIFFRGSLFINNSFFYNLTHYVISFNSSGDYVLSNITILNSYFSGSSGSTTTQGTTAVILSLRGDLVIVDNCTFVNNDAGCVGISAGDIGLVNNSNFINNWGGVSGSSGTIIVDNCIFADYGGGNGGALVRSTFIYNSVFRNNRQASISNSYYDEVSRNTVIYNCSFINNTLPHENSGSYTNPGIIRNNANLSIYYSVFVNNSAGYGGVICNYGNDYNYANLTVSCSVFVNNSANLGSDVFVYGGSVYLSNNWWGLNSGPTHSRVYRFLGDVYIDNWVILTLSVNGNSVVASLDKVTDSSGNIYDFDGVLPNRFAVFDSEIVSISPRLVGLSNNYAYSAISSGHTKDFRINVTVDGQTVDLTVHNRDTVFELNNTVFYGKGNVLVFILTNVNGYKIVNQKVTFIIRDQNNKTYEYNISTNEEGVAKIVINNTVGVYNVSAVYYGDGYFNSCYKSAIMNILISATNIFIPGELFYGKNNVLYVILQDSFGRALSGQKITFNISGNGKNQIITAITDDYGRAGIIVNLPKGSYSVKAIFMGDGWYKKSESDGSFAIASIATNLTIETFILYGKDNPFYIKLLDANGNVVANETIVLTIYRGNESQFFNLTTDENGIAGLMINLLPGTYKVSAYYKGDDLYIVSTDESDLVVKKVSTILKAEGTVIFNKNNNIYQIFLMDAYYRPLSGELVKITIQNSNFSKTFTALTNNEGIISLTLDLEPGNYLIIVEFLENEWYTYTTTSSTLIVTESFEKTNLTLNFTKEDDTLILYLTDSENNPIGNKTININIRGDDYNNLFTVKTNDEGIVRLPLNLKPGSYNVSYSFEGDSYYSPTLGSFSIDIDFEQIITKIITYNITMKHGEKKNFTLKLVDADGNHLIGKNIILSVTGNGFNKTYYLTTNDKGEITLPINLGAGKYSLKYSYAGEGVYKSTAGYSTLTITSSTKSNTVKSKTSKAKLSFLAIAYKKMVKKGKFSYIIIRAKNTGNAKSSWLKIHVKLPKSLKRLSFNYPKLFKLNKWSFKIAQRKAMYFIMKVKVNKRGKIYVPIYLNNKLFKILSIRGL